MQSTASPVQAEGPKQTAEKLVLSILLAAAFCHFLNDMVQSLIPAIYPILKKSFHLDFGQIGMITLTYQITASLLQPLIGHFNDRHPRPYSLRGRHGLHAGRLGDAFACRPPIRCC